MYKNIEQIENISVVVENEFFIVFEYRIYFLQSNENQILHFNDGGHMLSFC